MTDFDRSQIKATFKKISAWGRAIEAGNDGLDELSELQTIVEENPALLSEAVEYAEMCQSIASDSNELERSNSSHPSQRLARIHVLKGILWPDGQDTAPSPEIL